MYFTCTVEGDSHFEMSCVELDVTFQLVPHLKTCFKLAPSVVDLNKKMDCRGPFMLVPILPATLQTHNTHLRYITNFSA